MHFLQAKQTDKKDYCTIPFFDNIAKKDSFFCVKQSGFLGKYACETPSGLGNCVSGKYCETQKIIHFSEPSLFFQENSSICILRARLLAKKRHET